MGSIDEVSAAPPVVARVGAQVRPDDRHLGLFSLDADKPATLAPGRPPGDAASGDLLMTPAGSLGTSFLHLSDEPALSEVWDVAAPAIDRALARPSPTSRRWRLTCLASAAPAGPLAQRHLTGEASW